MTSATRLFVMPWVAANTSRWWYADREVRTAGASSRAPTTCSGLACLRYGLPPTVTSAAGRGVEAEIIRIAVDLAAPLGPRNPVTIPECTVKLKSSTAVLPPNLFVRFFASIIVTFRCVDVAGPGDGDASPGVRRPSHGSCSPDALAPRGGGTSACRDVPVQARDSSGCASGEGMLAAVMGDGLKPLTTSQMPSESSQAAMGRVAIAETVETWS